jgi:hypothetical protein
VTAIGLQMLAACLSLILQVTHLRRLDQRVQVLELPSTGDYSSKTVHSDQLTVITLEVRRNCTSWALF